jgi:hypothetical protein
MIGRLTAVTLAVGLTLTACDGNSGGSATPPPFTPSTPPTAPTATPSPSAGADAVEAYRQFIAATDLAANSGGVDVSRIRQFASGAMLASELNQAATFRGNRWRSTGQQKVVWGKAVKIGPANSQGQITQVTVQACVDGSQAIAVDAAGKRIRPSTAPTQVIDQMRMVLAKGVWQANFPESRKGGKC